PLTQIYTLSLHDALPISRSRPSAGFRADIGARMDRGRWRDTIPPPLHRKNRGGDVRARRAEIRANAARNRQARECPSAAAHGPLDRKSTRLNSSHLGISY